MLNKEGTGQSLQRWFTGSLQYDIPGGGFGNRCRFAKFLKIPISPEASLNASLSDPDLLASKVLAPQIAEVVHH